MPTGQWYAAGVQEQKEKLAQSYQELLDEFGSKDLRSVGNYNVGRLIGKGSFGKVYLASHRLTNGSKVVLKSAKKDDQNLAREIHHHRQFVHPHIARLYEVIVTESLVWLVLEWCPGDELYNYLLQNGRMEEAQVQKIFTQLVGAVSYVHLKGCVHRDLKLENILLDKHQNVKLVDFGFTREYQGTSSYLQTWCGTVAYSAPEMIKGEKYAGEKVDVWSLGIILYALLAGQLPFDDDDDNITKSRILKEDPVYPDYFPQAAKDMCNTLLSKRPLLRPTLPDILRRTWLAEHAPQQQEILKLQQPLPFTTQLEKDTLARMRSAGVDVDMVVDHVLAQRCDCLAGWWALLMEKEERKAKKRERIRKEKEAAEKALKRLSAASGRLLGTPSLRGIHEEDGMIPILGQPLKVRGRHPSRSSMQAHMMPDLPRVVESSIATPNAVSRARTPARSTSSSRRRPLPPPKETPRKPSGLSRSSSGMYKHMQPSSDRIAAPGGVIKRKKLYQRSLKDQLAAIKQWFKDPGKKHKSPTRSPKLVDSAIEENRKDGPSPIRRSSTTPLALDKDDELEPLEVPPRSRMASGPRLSTTSSHGSTHSVLSRSQVKRLSMSPQPLTPRSASNRRRSGLGRRKSTSSSVSSVRSMHLAHPSAISHSKASSTSSASPSISSPNFGSAPPSRLGTSDGNGLRVQPPSPTDGNKPLTIAAKRSRTSPGALGLLPSFGDMQRSNSGGLGPQSPGMHAVFARQKRKVFKGPLGTGGGLRQRNVTPTAGLPSPGSKISTAHAPKRQSVEVVGAGSVGIVEEEDEEEEDDLGEDVEYVERNRQSLDQIALSTFEGRAQVLNLDGHYDLRKPEYGDDDDCVAVESVDFFAPSSADIIVENAAHDNGVNQKNRFSGYFKLTHPAEAAAHNDGPAGIIAELGNTSR